MTLSDYVGLRFESPAARFVGGAVIVFASLLYMTAIYKGIGNLLETLLAIPYRTAVIVVLVVTMLYTAAGGFLSVVRTDVVQGVIVLIGAVILFTGVALANGGPLSVLEVRNLPGGERLFSLDAAVPFPVMLGIFVAGAGKLLVDPRQLSRFYGLADEAGVRCGMWTSTAAFQMTFALLLPARPVRPAAAAARHRGHRPRDSERARGRRLSRIARRPPRDRHRRGRHVLALQRAADHRHDLPAGRARQLSRGVG